MYANVTSIKLQVKPWSSQLCTEFLQLRREAWKFQDFNGVWTRDLAIPVRRSNQLSCEATDVGSWSFVGANVPVRMNQRWNDVWNGSDMNCGYEIKWSYDPRSYVRSYIRRSYMIHFIYHFNVDSRPSASGI